MEKTIYHVWETKKNGLTFIFLEIDVFDLSFPLLPHIFYLSCTSEKSIGVRERSCCIINTSRQGLLYTSHGQ